MTSSLHRLDLGTRQTCASWCLCLSQWTGRVVVACISQQETFPHLSRCRSIGYYDQAYKLMSDLKTLIDAHDAAVGRDYEARLSAQHEARQHLDDLLQRQARAKSLEPRGEQDGSEVSQNESSKRD